MLNLFRKDESSSIPGLKALFIGVMLILPMIILWGLFVKGEIEDNDKANSPNKVSTIQGDPKRDKEREQLAENMDARNLRMLGDRFAAALFINTKLKDKALQSQIKGNAFIMKRLASNTIDIEKDPKDRLKKCSSGATAKNPLVIRYTRLPSEYISITNGSHIVVYHVVTQKDVKRGLSATSDIFFC